MKLHRMLLMSLTLCPTWTAAASWAVDPAVPGSDRAASGTSLFELLIRRNDSVDIPFPFERLIAQLESTAGCRPADACTRALLIPLGRSLQRVAGGPDYFVHPRAVVAFVGDVGTSVQVRDRLYLGYQEQANQLEVISYNEALARFEFQVVSDYRAGGRPVLRQAARRMCISCHQNQGPIFSRQVWSETSANPVVGTRLSEHRSSFFGIPARSDTGVANAIDDATDRASRLLLTQRLWQDGCGPAPAGDACRRGALLASLQLALTADRAFDVSDRFQSDVTTTLRQRARLLWPQGLSVPTADIHNRDPFDVPDVPPRLDPLQPREPLEVLPAEGDALALSLVRGIRDFWSDRQLQQIDRTAMHGNVAPRHRVTARCRLDSEAGNTRFDCNGAGPPELRISGMAIEDEPLGELSFKSVPLRHVRVAALSRLATAASESTLRFQLRDHDRQARVATGAAIESVALYWSPASKGLNGRIEFSLRDDLAIVATGMSWDGPLRSADLTAYVEPLTGRTETDCFAVLTASLAEASLANSGAAGEVAAPFESACGSCHDTPEATPPNFLYGNSARVSRALESCAPRLFVRLSMNDIPGDQRAKSPMPPEELAGPVAIASLAEMRARVEITLRKRYGRVPAVSELLLSGYDNLPPCLPIGA
jgi:cytochrome c553